MELYGLMIPLVTLATGAVISAVITLKSRWINPLYQWQAQGVILFFSMLQFALICFMEPTVFLRGELVYDDLSKGFGIIILLHGFLTHLCRRDRRTKESPSANTEFILALFFSVYSVLSYRLLSSMLALLFLYFVGALSLSEGGMLSARIRSAGKINAKTHILLVVTVFSVLLCMMLFGDFQFDRIKAVLSGDLKISAEGLFFLQGLLVFWGAYMSGLIPSLWVGGVRRSEATNSLTLGVVPLFMLTGAAFLMRWGGALFQGSTQDLAIEPLFLIRTVSSFALIFVPVAAFFVKSIRERMLYALQNTLALGVFLLGREESSGYAMGLLVLLGFPFLSAGVSAALQSLSNEEDIKELMWRGAAYKNVLGAVGLVCLTAVSFGVPPSFAGFNVWSSLESHGPEAIILLVNFALGSLVVLKTAAGAFERTTDAAHFWPEPLSWKNVQLMSYLFVLILLGIFWQPLYKYGSGSLLKIFSA